MKKRYSIIFLMLTTFSLLSAEKPSVLMINVDDWNDWNEVLKGHPQAITPHIKRLAERGVTFSNAICASPSCVPSRPSFFTGIAPGVRVIFQMITVCIPGVFIRGKKLLPFQSSSRKMAGRALVLPRTFIEVINRSLIDTYLLFQR